MTSALSIAAHTEGATPNSRVASGLVKVSPGMSPVMFPDSFQEDGKRSVDSGDKAMESLGKGKPYT